MNAAQLAILAACEDDDGGTGMNGQQIYPEGSTVFIGRDSYTTKLNPNFPGIDLYQGGWRVMTVCHDYLQFVLDEIKYPEARS